MSVYQTKKNSDGTLSLSDSQMRELEERKYTSDQIYSALLNFYEMTKLKSSQKIIDGSQPCAECGNIKLIQTGNCHVCALCGASQGCS